jgi:3-oxoacyl-[acyl-carrier-protein] synthase II
MYYINACSTISHQDSFQNESWINELKILTNNSELITPNYKDFIDAADLRRMSKIIRIGIACSKDCIRQAGIDNPDAIIVGTGLGCLADTEKFLHNTLTIKGLMPPTSFIQSTHNTTAGQISLALKNHQYNMTHTQNSLSFEHALMDGMLCLDEGINSVLVGSADENIPLMDQIAHSFNWSEIENKLTSGASFFIVSNAKNNSTKVQIIDCFTVVLNNTIPKALINSFLAKNNLSLSDIDLVLFNSNGTLKSDEILNEFNPIPVLAYEQYCGYYFTNVAFGIHLATEILSKKKSFWITNKKPIHLILLYNNFNNKNIGLTLLQTLET